MFAFLASSLGKYVIGFGVIAIVIGGFYAAFAFERHKAQSLQSRLDAAQVNVERLAAINAENAAALDELKKQRQFAEQVTATLRQQLSAMILSLEKAKEMVRKAPPSEDGPVAPVLKRALDSLPAKDKP